MGVESGGVRWSPQVLDIFGPEDLNGSSGTLESLESPQPEGGKGGKYKVHLSHLSHDGVISVKRKNFIILCKVQLFGLRNDLHNGKGWLDCRCPQWWDSHLNISQHTFGTFSRACSRIGHVLVHVFFSEP